MARTANIHSLPQAEPTISEADFERFRDYFYKKTGIQFEDSKRYFVDKRLIERIQATEHDSFRAYFTFMRFQASGDELQQLINRMTVNETYFFREEYQFQCMVGPVLEEIVRHKRRGEPVRIWSIPSSTGEEPFSIAIYLLEHWPAIDSVDVELLSSDIDSNVLKTCRRGRYSQRSIAQLPKPILKKWFTPQGGEYQLSNDILECVKFEQVNLSNPADTRKFRDIDLIFCRNLLIYFDDASRRQAAETFYDALGPGGFIFLGHSESMSRISSLFRVRKFPDAIAYQKPT